MRYHEFGTGNSHALLFFQGSASHWSWYQESIDKLAQKYHVIVPAIDGHDSEENKDFISVEKTVDEVTRHLLGDGCKEIYAVYGLSFGGSMALRMLAEKRIPIKKAIVDGGITPYQIPYILTRIILLRDYWMVRILRSDVRLVKMVFDPKRWTPEGKDEETEYAEMMRFLNSMSKRTLKNVFDSANNYALPDPIPVLDTEIEYWYGSLEKKSRARDLRYVKKVFPNVAVKEIPNMEHGELVMIHPQQFWEMADGFLSEKHRQYTSPVLPGCPENVSPTSGL